MAAHRRHVFVGKVLERLFPRAACGQDKAALAPAARSPPRKAAPERAKQEHVPPLTGGDTAVQWGRRLYTVSLPPEGYVPGPPQPHSCPSSEDSSSSDDVGGQDPHDQPKRRRIRKPKSRKKFKPPNNIAVQQAELEKQQGLSQEKLQGGHTNGPTISRNKRRKLKKKQQIKRKKAAGLLTGASGISFMYEPQDSGSEQGDVQGRDPERSAGAEEEEQEEEEEAVPGAKQEEEEEAVPGAKQEEEEQEEEEGAPGTEGRSGDSTQDKADGILKFLKSTQEIYFYDGASKDADPILLEATEDLFRSLETRSVPPADVLLLDRMKTLLLLRDARRLTRALDAFPAQCAMPPGHARVISAFFNYWITHILPEKNSDYEMG